MRKIPRRAGQSRGGGSMSIRDTWECKDGWVAFSIYRGEFGGRMNKVLIDWIDSEGLAPEQMKSLDWHNLDMAKVSDEVVIQIEECIGNFFKRHTRIELFEGCMEKGINLCPVWTAPDLLDFVQLKERNYWVTVNHPELEKTLKHTGPFFSSTEVDDTAIRPAPLIGQHNSEVYSELLDYSEAEIHTLKKEGVI